MTPTGLKQQVKTAIHTITAECDKVVSLNYHEAFIIPIDRWLGWVGFGLGGVVGHLDNIGNYAT